MRLGLVLPLLVIWAAVATGQTELWREKGWISIERFESICARAAHNVDLFQKIWQVDPEAKIYGGTSRNFAWFVRGELSRATSRDDLEARIEKLTARPIQIKEFVVGQSDVDVITGKDLSTVDFDKSYLTQLETISPDWFDPSKREFHR